MAANPPRMPTGTIGTSKAVASWAAPSRNRPICPSDDRVPSGKTTRFQRSLSRAPGVAAEAPPLRSIGTVANTNAVETARNQLSKK